MLWDNDVVRTSLLIARSVASGMDLAADAAISSMRCRFLHGFLRLIAFFWNCAARLACQVA